MPFAMIGLFLGGTYGDPVYDSYLQNQLVGYLHPFVVTALLVMICMVTARSAAMAFNRYLDRSFDAKNPRTAIREIPQ